MELKAFGIGVLSRETGCHIETIRYYEKSGLLPEPPRTTGRHRVYGQEHLRRLNFIRRSRELGFSISDIRGLLQMVEGNEVSCRQVRELALDHLASVRAKIADLKRMESTLKKTAAECEGGNTPECPIIDVLFESTSGNQNRRAGRTG